MIVPKLSRRAALILGKAAGVLIISAVGGTVSWLLDRERRRVQAEAVRVSEEPTLVLDLPTEVKPEAPEDAPEGRETDGETLGNDEA